MTTHTINSERVETEKPLYGKAEEISDRQREPSGPTVTPTIGMHQLSVK